jgi:hypothetical protein
MGGKSSRSEVLYCAPHTAPECVRQASGEGKCSGLSSGPCTVSVDCRRDCVSGRSSTCESNSRNPNLCQLLKQEGERVCSAEKLEKCETVHLVAIDPVDNGRATGLYVCP